MREGWLGPLGKRLFVAFLVVAIASVGTLSAAALIGTQQGINAQERTSRQSTVNAMAARISREFRTMVPADGLTRLDYTPVIAMADAANVRFVVRDLSDTVVTAYRIGNGPANGMGAGMMGMPQADSGRWVSVALTVEAEPIGTLSVWFPTSLESSAQTVAWTWIAVAAVVALLVAFALAWFVSRRIARPLRRISSAAQRFADGDRAARTDPRDAAANWELGELARAFDATADNVVRSETARRHIAADVAHELRTPLTVLQAGLEEVRDGLVPADAEHLSTLHTQAMRLSRIVEDLSSLAAAETAALSLHIGPADLAQVARSALREAASSLEAAGLETVLDAEVALPVLADADRMHQAVANLLANAARYCRPGDRVTVRAVAEHGHAVISVEDTGPGVAEHELPHVFERLWRGDSARNSEGSGIGLAVVRELVVAQGGAVDATRNPSGGLTVTIRMPLHTP